MARTQLPAFAVLLMSGAACWIMIRSSYTFVFGSAMPSSTQLRGRTATKATVAEYPNLERLEDVIQESCLIKEDEMYETCARSLKDLTKLHQESLEECQIEQPSKCIMLDVLDKLLENVDGKDGVITVNRIVQEVNAANRGLKDWEAAFQSIDKDKSGSISLHKMREALKKSRSRLTDAEVTRMYNVIDSDGNGSISKEEFKMVAAAVAEADVAVREIVPDRLPQKQPSFEEYMRLTSSRSPKHTFGYNDYSKLSKFR